MKICQLTDMTAWYHYNVTNIQWESGKPQRQGLTQSIYELKQLTSGCRLMELGFLMGLANIPINITLMLFSDAGYQSLSSK